MPLKTRRCAAEQQDVADRRLAFVSHVAFRQRSTSQDVVASDRAPESHHGTTYVLLQTPMGSSTRYSGSKLPMGLAAKEPKLTDCAYLPFNPRQALAGVSL